MPNKGLSWNLKYSVTLFLSARQFSSLAFQCGCSFPAFDTVKRILNVALLSITLLLNLPGTDLGNKYFSEVLIYFSSSVEWRNASLSFLSSSTRLCRRKAKLCMSVCVYKLSSHAIIASFLLNSR